MGLFKTFVDVKNYIGADVNNELVTVEPYFDMAVLEYIRPVMGDVEYDYLVEMYEADTLNAAQDRILPYVQAAIVHFGYYAFANDGTMSITDAGFMRQEHSEAKSAYQWMTRDFKNQRWSQAWKELEKLAKLLYANMSDYDDWAICEEREDWNELPVWNTKQFAKFYRIDNWGTLWKLHPTMRDYIEKTLKPQITAQLYNLVMDEMMADSMSGDSTALMLFIQRTVVMAALKDTVMDAGYEFGRLGLQSVTVEPRSGDSDKVTTASRLDRQMMLDEFARKEKEALNLMVNYLNANATADKYASYWDKFINVTAPVVVDYNDGKGVFLI